MPNVFLKPYSKLLLDPVPRLMGSGCVPQIPGIVLALALNAEEISNGLYFHTFDGSVRRDGSSNYFGFDFEMRGTKRDLQEMARLIRLRQLLTHEDPEILGVIGASMKVVRMQPREHKCICATIRTEDQAGIVREFCREVLAEQGTLHSIHCDTANSGLYPGTPDFFLRSVAAFADAESALMAIDRIKLLPYREVFAAPLFADPSRGNFGEF
ncbi:MAG: hypothetical protein KF757_06365 [Phycisphaeraceae bacterium]|nr:hypothetical protein [Phycisphaeraceae bacterium]MCW5763227.1 hypothetical protein [Phycisphaeraceae bacterium]